MSGTGERFRKPFNILYRLLKAGCSNGSFGFLIPAGVSGGWKHSAVRSTDHSYCCLRLPAAMLPLPNAP